MVLLHEEGQPLKETGTHSLQSQKSRPTDEFVIVV